MGIRKLLAVFLVLGFAASLAACETMGGFGRDVEDAGESIQEEAD